MAIATLKKVTLVGVAADKTQVLNRLQELGVIHLIDISPKPIGISQTDPFRDNREALAYLESCPVQQRPLRKRPKQFQPDVTIAQVLKLKARANQLRDEADRFQRQIDFLEPWGDFQLPAPTELHGLQMFFYAIPPRDLKKITDSNYAYEVVNKDARLLYVVVIRDTLPDLPFTPIVLPQMSRSESQDRLEYLLDELEKCETRRIGETRLIDLLREHLNQSLDQRDLTDACEKTYNDTGLFGVQGWCPVKLLSNLQEVATELGLACEVSNPAKDEQPPTYLENNKWLKPGELLVGVFSVPAYHAWDTTIVVYLSFVILFGMIISDAGYGLLYLCIVLFFRSSLIKSGNRSLFYIFSALTISTIVYGVLAGSYFGVSPEVPNLAENKPGNILAPLKVLQLFDPTDLKNLSTMMAVSIVVGSMHIVLSNAIAMYGKRHSQKSFAHVGWIIVTLSGLAAWLEIFFFDQPVLGHAMLYGVGVGLVLVVLFSHPAPFTPMGTFHRLLGGFESLTKISKIFGDILSYLRVFALGIAGAYLAITFNQLADGASKLGPEGFLLSTVILLFGHAINFALATMAGVIHGLRLIFIEFYSWSVEDEGSWFTPFKKHSKSN